MAMPNVICDHRSCKASPQPQATKMLHAVLALTGEGEVRSTLRNSEKDLLGCPRKLVSGL